MITSHKRARRAKMLYFMLPGILCLVFVCAWTPQSSAQEDLTLSLPAESVQGFQGQDVDLDLTLSYPGSATASGFQLDINYDTNVLENPSAIEGTVLTDPLVDKEIESSEPSSGVFRIVVSGLNQNIIPAGTVATISFDIKPDASLGVTNLTLSGLQATEPDGDPLVVAGGNGSVEVLAATIPTLSEWGVIIMTTILLVTGMIVIIRRRRLKIENA